MIPQKGHDLVEIPVTFDSRGGSVGKGGKPIWAALVVGVWLFISILVLIAGQGFWRFGFPFFSFILLTYVLRFLIARELFYKSKRRELVENDYMFSHNLFWGAYEVSNRFPYIVQFANGMKGVFVALDKDVIVGKGKDYAYYHHEAIAQAYQQMDKRGIDCIHIDFMDIVGRDSRLNSLFSEAERIENSDLRKVIMRKYDHIEATMNRSYASYDVYAFYFSGRDESVWDDLQVILGYFKQANYIRARVLNRDAISVLVESLMNIDEFSVNQACDNLYKEINRSEFLNPIWVEVDGERTILNKTTEEKKEENRVREAEKKVKRKRSGFSKKRSGNEELDLFE